MKRALHHIISATKHHQSINRVILVADIISALILLLFLYTSISKLADHEVFKNVLAASPLLKPYAGIIAWLLPLLEIAIVVLLFVPSLKLKGLYASLTLIILFTIYLIYMIMFTPKLPCNCGGVIKLLSWPQHILFNLFFVFLSVAGIVLFRKAKKLKSSPPP